MADVSDHAQVEDAARQAEEFFGPIDVWARGYGTIVQVGSALGARSIPLQPATGIVAGQRAWRRGRR